MPLSGMIPSMVEGSREQAENRPHQRMLDGLIKRLIRSISRSPLLKVSPRPTGRQIDVARFRCVNTCTTGAILTSLIKGEVPARIDFDLRLVDAADGLSSEQHVATEGSNEAGRKERATLYRQLETTRRAAELAFRETGVRALWLGYPLIYVPASADPDVTPILAPICLFPAQIQLDRNREGRVFISRLADAAPRFNSVMKEWVSRKCNIEVPVPSKDDLDELTTEALDSIVQAVAESFRPPPVWRMEQNVIAVPTRDSLNPRDGVKLFDAAVLGLFRWQNESILADLECLRCSKTCGESLRGYLEGQAQKETPRVSAPSEDDRYLVQPADHSQQQVVWRARRGPGLVVHGPPGTGKSQTIVNIIADALAHGERVLMVCQKEAATRVVLKRLRQAGLDHLCMELHDAETDRQAVFKQVRQRVDDVRAGGMVEAPRKRQALADEIRRIEADLDAFASAMHARHERIRLSYKEILAVEGKALKECPSVRPLAHLAGLARTLSVDDLKQLLETVEHAGNLFEGSRFLSNPWRRRRVQHLTPAARLELQSAVERVADLDTRHQSTVAEYRAGMNLPEDIGAFRSLVPKLLKVAAESEEMSPGRRNMLAAWFRELDTHQGESDRVREVDEAKDCVRKALKARSAIDRAWREAMTGSGEVERLEVISACRVVARRRAWWRWLFSEFRKCVRLIRKRRPDAMGSAIHDVASSGLAHFDADIVMQRAIDLAFRLLPGLTPPSAELEAVEAFVEDAGGTLALAVRLRSVERKHGWAAPLIHPLRSAAANVDRKTVAAFEAAMRRAETAESLVAAIRRLQEFLEPASIEPLVEKVLGGKTVREDAEAVLDGADRLESLRSLEGVLEAPHEPDRETVTALVRYEEERARGDALPQPPVDLPSGRYGRWWAALVSYTIASEWREEFIRAHPILRRIGPDDREHLVERLEERLKEKKSLEVGAINAEWNRRQHEALSFPWQSIFKLRGAKGSPSHRLREAVRQSVDKGLLDLFPCWLTNPGAAAQVFPPEKGLFDVVIFDEASQCPLEQAIPAISRGKRVIVCGDEKQLPPTSFFAADADADTDEEPGSEEEEADVQKIIAEGTSESKDLLEASIPLLPESYLLIHYRSEHPALIEFSNRAFYRGRLEPLPSKHLAENVNPIEYIEVGGTYEPLRRVNRQEAERVVSTVKSLLLNSTDHPTVGVVTFNQPQRELIVDLLDKECAADRDFQARYEAELARMEDGQDAGLFVKNLENVQGDERDVMVFSTTFGRDANGEFRRTFGPLGQVGGERRLNVAVTRAKRRVIVIGSMPIEQIDEALSGRAGVGAGLRPRSYLQLYLAYAQAVARAECDRRDRVLELVLPRTNVKPGHDFESPLEEEVYEALRRLGYTVHPQVGASGFRIDLAVLHPEPSKGYVLGIECDGAAYHSGRSARLRDVWRQQILEDRGWRFHRVWSTRWWNDPAGEVERLRERIEALINSPG